jgi:hypothetical protein
VGGEHAPWAADGAWQVQDQIADLSAELRAAVGTIGRQGCRRHSGGRQLAVNEIHDGRFLATAAWNRHQLHRHAQRCVVAGAIVYAGFRLV